jgi:hypothetical protein
MQIIEGAWDIIRRLIFKVDDIIKGSEREDIQGVHMKELKR